MFIPKEPKKQDKEHQKFIGLYIDKKLAKHLQFYALSIEKSVSEVIRDLISDKVEMVDSEEAIIEHLSKQAHEEWLQWYQRSKGLPGWRNFEQITNRYKDYKDRIHRTLRIKKVGEDIIQQLLEELDKIEIGEDKFE